jgi:hypothetical protein
MRKNHGRGEEVAAVSGNEVGAGVAAEPRQAGTIERLVTRNQSMCAEARELLRDIVRCDRDDLWSGDGAGSLAEWLSARLGISNWRARRMIEAGYALEKLPSVAAALASGALSLDKTLELARFATPEDERKLVTWALKVHPGAIRRKADELQKRAADELPDRTRFLRTWWSDDRESLHLEGLLPAPEGAAFRKAIDRIAWSLPDMPPAEDGTLPDEEQSIEERRADALRLMASAHIAGDQDPDLATVVVYADGDGYHLEGGIALHPETFRRLSCDARVQLVTETEDHITGVGRTQRVIPRRIRRLALHREEGTCAFPGCERATFLHPHHVTHWTRDGLSDLNNTIMLCTRHHDLVHEGGWSVAWSGDRALFFRPSGRVYDPHPPELKDELERLRDEEQRSHEEPPKGSIEARFGIENYRLKEIATGMTDDLYEVARNLAGA